MNWKIVIKDASKQPQKGTYRDWKILLAEEGYNQCVYCAVHENVMGGIRNFHVEHYRPKSLFKDLENDYTNLFYACPICNTFKNNDWPNEPLKDNSVASYPNPSENDYSLFFEVDTSTGLIEGKNVAARYIQEKLFLNRPQLISARRTYFLLKKGNREIEETRRILYHVQDNYLYRQYSQAFIDLMSEFNKLLQRFNEIPHYELSDVTRP